MKRYWLNAARIEGLREAGCRVVWLGESRIDHLGREVFLVAVYT